MPWMEQRMMNCGGEVEDPFANLDDDDVEMLHAAGINPETYQQISGSSDTEDEFYGF